MDFFYRNYLNTLVVTLFVLLISPFEIGAKDIEVVSIEDFKTNRNLPTTFVVRHIIDFKGEVVDLAPKSKVFFHDGGAIYNGGIIIKNDSKIVNGVFIVDKKYCLNDVLVIRGADCQVINTKVNGTSSKTRFGISVFDSPRTKIFGCSISNIGEGSDNTAGIRLQGDCSRSVLSRLSIEDVTAKINASGVLIQYSESSKLFSTKIIIRDSKICRITPVEDGDGIKILQNHRKANHLIQNCSFIDCSKRAIKVQGLGVRCLNNYVSGGCNEAIVDYQNGDCSIVGLKADHLGYVYAGIYIQGSEGPITIKEVEIFADNTERQYVRGIKIKRSSWDDNRPISKILVTNCRISNFYQSFSIEGFNEVKSLMINNCSFSSVASPLYIDVRVNKLSIHHTRDKILNNKERKSLHFSRSQECRISRMDIQLEEKE